MPRIVPSKIQPARGATVLACAGAASRSTASAITTLRMVQVSPAMPKLSAERIRHQVVFTLKHAAGSEEEAGFFAAILALEAIPGVEAFELNREVSPKNAFDHALTMEFADRAAYEAY